MSLKPPVAPHDPLNEPAFQNVIEAGNISGSYVVDLAGDAETWITATLTGNTTITVTNLGAGALARFFITQDSTGGWTLEVSDTVVSGPVSISSLASATTEFNVLTSDGEELVITGTGTQFGPLAKTTDYTLVATDAGRVIAVSSASATTVTVPTDATAAFNIGDTVDITEMSYGQVRVSPATGVTLRSRRNYRAISDRYGRVTLRKRAINDWVLTGDLAEPHTYSVTTDVPNLVAYFKADNVVGVDGAAVATWPDSGGGGYDLLQATGANKPVKKTAIVNGHAVVRFDGINDYLAHATLPATGVSTIYIVAKETAAVGATQTLIDRGTVSTGKLSIDSGRHFLVAAALQGDLVPATGWFVGVGVFNGANGVAAVDENADVTGSASATTNGLTVGAQADTNNPFGGDIEEIIVCNAAHSIDTRRAVVEYLMGQIAA